MFAVNKMWYKNIDGRFFGLVTKHACDRRMDGQNYYSQDRASIAASRGNNNHWGTVSIEYPRASVYYDIQWKRIRGIPLYKNRTITQTQQIKMHILNLI